MLEEILIEIVLSKMVKDCRGPSVLGNDDILLFSKGIQAEGWSSIF